MRARRWAAEVLSSDDTTSHKRFITLELEGLRLSLDSAYVESGMLKTKMTLALVLQEFEKMFDNSNTEETSVNGRRIKAE